MDFLAIQGVRDKLDRWARRAGNKDEIFLLKETMKKIMRLKFLSINGLLSMYFTFWLVSLLHKWINFHCINGLISLCIRYDWFPYWINVFIIGLFVLSKFLKFVLVRYAWRNNSTKSDAHVRLRTDISYKGWTCPTNGPTLGWSCQFHQTVHLEKWKDA
jgi:hypothetical protein